MDAAAKVQKQEAAARMLERIQAAVNVGEDYRLVDIVRLRQMCRVRTPGGGTGGARQGKGEAIKQSAGRRSMWGTTT